MDERFVTIQEWALDFTTQDAEPCVCNDHDADPMIHFRFLCPDIRFEWFVAGMRNLKGDVEFVGYTRGATNSYWAEFLLSDLLQIKGPHGLSVRVDRGFRARRASCLGLRAGRMSKNRR